MLAVPRKVSRFGAFLRVVVGIDVSNSGFNLAGVKPLGHGTLPYL